jgi:hypothetical protein
VLDADGDGDLDLAFANYYAPPTLYENDGRGRFQDVSAARMPATAFGTHDVAASDFDGDGDADLAFFDYADAPRLLRNSGTGSFVDATAGNLPATAEGERAYAFDRDQDGDIDLVSSYRDRTYVLDNDGQGRFTELQVLSSRRRSSPWATSTTTATAICYSSLRMDPSTSPPTSAARSTSPASSGRVVMCASTSTRTAVHRDPRSPCR